MTKSGEGLKYSESSLIGKAITYAYTRWDNMMRYLDDGRLLLDNNLAENEIRPVTLGRKRSTFGRFAMQRTTSSAVTMRLHRIWPSSALCWRHAETTMSIPDST